MANNYDRWTRVTNPPLGVLTNNFVNFYQGVSITQTGASPLHVLPNTFIGKTFHINNEGTSTNPVTISVNTQNGYETFTIQPGDSGVFTNSGNGQWDQVAGEEVFNALAQGFISGGGGTATDSRQNQFSRTIAFNDAPDGAGAIYSVGTVPAGFSVSDITITVTTLFNDSICDSVKINSTTAGTLMDYNESDIAKAGTYTVSVPAVTTVSTGLIQAEFNSTPNGSGGNQGSLTIIVEYLAI